VFLDYKVLKKQSVASLQHTKFDDTFTFTFVILSPVMSKEFKKALNEIPLTVYQGDLTEYYSSMSDEYKAAVSAEDFISFFMGPSRATFLWHDYEAGGTNAKTTVPMQFAGVRTDMDLNVIDIPIDIYCKLDCDKLPHPEAVAITKINPMKCLREGLPEPEFFRQINQEMSMPETCVTGFNSMKYDEEMTRFGLWRSLIPVYKREFENGNSRWDLLPVVSAFASLKAPGLIVPTNEEGLPTVKLELLALANGITQVNSHNAVDDTFALIDLAKLLKASNPELWNYLYENRKKKTAAGRCATGSVGMFFSTMMGAKNNFAKPVLIIGDNPSNKNSGKICVSLENVENVRSMWKLSADDIRERLYMKSESLEENGWERPPLTSFKINESPAFISFEWLSRHGFSAPDVSSLGAAIYDSKEFIDKLLTVFNKTDFPVEDNPELKLYSGFPSTNDGYELAHLANIPTAEAFSSERANFESQDLNVLYLNARAKLRGTPHISIDDDEIKAWLTYCAMCQTKPLSEKESMSVVNLTNVEEMLENTEMDPSLREGYAEYLVYVKRAIGNELSTG
tara:strand:- start:2272 stop:3972 length:1701 start_codon:yes stop_codon:yes gene_type:complete